LNGPADLKLLGFLDDETKGISGGVMPRAAYNAPLSVAESKRTIHGGAGLAEDDAWILSEAAFHRIKDTADALEGPLAFAEKRQPTWQGR
jgi:hypothetical protein